MSNPQTPVPQFDSEVISGEAPLCADAGDEGFRFILFPPDTVPETSPRQGGIPNSDSDLTTTAGAHHPPRIASPAGGGIFLRRGEGHLVTIVGPGGTGKSIFSLQLASSLLRKEEESATGNIETRPHAVFYFTLEARPGELFDQLRRLKSDIQWRMEPAHPDPQITKVVCQSEKRKIELQIIRVPSPARDISSVVQLVRQRISSALPKIGRIIAIVIDPLGGIKIEEDLCEGLILIRDLCHTHRTFLFLLAEHHLYSKHPEIEHYAETVIHLDHNPKIAPYRTLHIQKARHQRFYSGFHQLDLVKGEGLRVYPSLRAQSRAAHSKRPNTTGANGATDLVVETEPFFSAKLCKRKGFNLDSEDFLGTIQRGSVIFLMGPPGTFKQVIATAFALSTPPPAHAQSSQNQDGDTKNVLYVSFKADEDHVISVLNRLRGRGQQHGNLDKILFLDKRNPIFTPEEILFHIWQELQNHKECRRAIIWGLRRLNDLPMFAGEKQVQFLEALVTLLTAQNITSLLVDWPDIESTSTLPIVDLSQYILLTRICRSRDRLSHTRNDASSKGKWFTQRRPKAVGLERELWSEDKENVALVRVQRASLDFERRKGLIVSRLQKKVDRNLRTQEEEASPYFEVTQPPEEDFERIWDKAGIPWEVDPGLVERRNF